MAITRRQREVLDVIQDFIGRNGYSPSLEEIGGALGLSSVATVHKHVTHLVEKGFVRRGWNQNRSIELVEPPDGAGVLRLPVSALIEGGRALESLPSGESVSVPVTFVTGRGRCTALRVRGDALREELLRDGDLLIVEQREEPRDGETVIALLDRARATVRRFYAGPPVRLESGGVPGIAMTLPDERVRIHSVVIALVRHFFS